MRLIFAPSLVLAQAGAYGSQDASQLAANSFVFILSAPANCLHVRANLLTIGKRAAFIALDSKRSPFIGFSKYGCIAAFHDAGTWDPISGKSGADSSLLSYLNTTENLGMFYSVAPKFMQNPTVNMTKADMISLAGQVSVSHCGGPSMTFSPGRVDTLSPTSPIGLIPAANASLLSFRPRMLQMGWTNEDIVALITGSHTMGGVHAANSPTVTNKTFVPFDDTPGIFDNHVFHQSLKNICAVPIDCDIANDPVLRPIVQRFANNQSAFFDQYALSFKKLTSQTNSSLGAPQNLMIAAHSGLFTTNQTTGAQFTNTPGNSQSPGSNNSFAVNCLSTATLIFALILSL